MATDNPTSLVKYFSITAGLKTLEKQCLRWSSPNLFNDPFELDHNYSPEIDADKLLKGLINEALAMLFGPNEPTGKNNQLVAAISRWRDEDRFASEEEAEQVLKQLLSQVANHQQKDLNHFVSNWKQFAQALRICCLSDKADNIACWKHYASNHQGIALRFAAGEDTHLKAPKRVIYKNQPLQLTNLKQQVDITYGKAKASNSEEFSNIPLTKNTIHSIEKEWRCFGSDLAQKDDPLEWYSDQKFATAELKAVYLGLNISEVNKETIKKLLKEHYNKTKLYQARIIPGQFAIDFTIID